MAAIQCKNCHSKDVRPVNYQSNWQENQAVVLPARRDKSQKTLYSCNDCGYSFEDKDYIPHHSEKRMLKAVLDFSEGWVYEWVGHPFKGGIGQNLKLYAEDGKGYTYFIAVFGEAYEELLRITEEGMEQQKFLVEFRYDKNMKLKGYVEKGSF